MSRQILKAMSDETRFKILELLRKEPLTAGEISSHFDMTFATISHHLSILKDADLISDHKQGKYVIYELNTSVIDDIIMFIYKLKKEN